MALAVKKSYTLLLITGSAGRNNILDHLSAGRNDILGHLGAGRNEKYIGFPIPLTITRMMLLCYSLGMVQVSFKFSLGQAFKKTLRKTWTIYHE